MTNPEKNEFNQEKSFRLVSIVYFLKSDKYPLFIMLGFFLITSYVIFFHHPYWFEFDGNLIFHVGKQILSGDGGNVKLVDVPIGGPIIYATLDSLFNNGFFTMKVITIFSGAGIVLFSYYIIKNIFNSRIAIIGQLLVAFNPQLQWQSTHIMPDIFPLFLIVISLYFITKNSLKLSDVIIVGLLLGISSMIRYQGDRKSTRLNSSHIQKSRMPSSA